jgi:hypothetical protein
MRAELIGSFINRVDAENPPERSSRPIMAELKPPPDTTRTRPADEWTRKQISGPLFDDSWPGPVFITGLRKGYYEPEVFNLTKLTASWREEKGDVSHFQRLLKQGVEVNAKYFFESDPNAHEFPQKEWGPYHLRASNFVKDARSLAEILFEGTDQLEEALRIADFEGLRLINKLANIDLLRLDYTLPERSPTIDDEAMRAAINLLSLGSDGPSVLSLSDGQGSSGLAEAVERWRSGPDAYGYLEIGVPSVHTPLYFASERLTDHPTTDLTERLRIALETLGRADVVRLTDDVSDAADALKKTKKGE